jgi:hypothetical protein
MSPLELDPARQMFRQYHSLDQQQLLQLNLHTLEGELLQACSGLPLALQVIGGALSVEEDTHPNEIRSLWKVRANCNPERGMTLLIWVCGCRPYADVRSRLCWA